jgi:hypothetical protein
MQDSARIDRSWLPDAEKKEMNFLESSFFKSNGPTRSLPTPAEVRARSPLDTSSSQPPPVKFENLKLVVKFGPHVSVAEAQCLWLIRKMLPSEVPVPEIYGWRVDGRLVFLYMQLIRGPTLNERWDALSDSDKTAVCDHLRQIITSLRRLKQAPGDSFIGMSQNT